MDRVNVCRKVSLTVGALLLSACFSYVPAELELTPPGDEVRVHVTRQGAAELTAVTANDELVPVLSGTVVGLEGSDLLIHVQVASRQVGFHAVGLEQTLRVPTGEILAVERKEFSAANTGLLAVAAAGASTALLLGIIRAFGQTSEGPVGPEDFHLLTIPIGW